MSELTSVGLRPEIWIVPTIGFALILLAVLIYVLGESLGAQDGHFFLSGLVILIGAAGVLTWLIMLIPYDGKYHALYHVSGEVASVSNVISESSGDLTQTPVVQLSGSDVSYLVDDVRAVNLGGKDVTLLCSIEFVYLGADRYNCVVAEVKP